MDKFRVDFGGYQYPTSVPEIIEERLRRDGDHDLADTIREDVDAYVCPICAQKERVGVGLDPDGNKLMYFCIDCSGSAIREVWEEQRNYARGEVMSKYLQ